MKVGNTGKRLELLACHVIAILTFETRFLLDVPLELVFNILHR